MPNHNYRAGRNLEYLVRKRMLKHGFLEVMRTAGSHGSADLIGVHKDGRIFLVQCKRTESKTEAKKLGRNFTAAYEKSNENATRCLVVYITSSREYITLSNGNSDWRNIFNE